MDRDKLNPNQLGKKCGVDQSTISRWVNAITKPTLESIERVANHFHVPAEYFICTDETRARIYLLLNDMNDEERKQALFHFEKEKLWKDSKRTA